MPPIGGLKKTRIICFSVNTLAILASINRPLFCEESLAMAEPLTKPRFDPQIEVNKPITPDVGQPSPSPTAAPTLDPARELPPSHRIHPVQGRQVREPKCKISEVATNIQQNASAAYGQGAAVANETAYRGRQHAADALRRPRTPAHDVLDEYPPHGSVGGAAAACAR